MRFLLPPTPNRNTLLLSFLFLGAKKPSRLYSEYYAVTADSAHSALILLSLEGESSEALDLAFPDLMRCCALQNQILYCKLGKWQYF